MLQIHRDCKAHVLVVGGGGGGGYTGSIWSGGGGGAGAVIFYPAFSLAAGVYSISVGAGGLRQTSGNSSSIDNIFVAQGGGAGSGSGGQVGGSGGGGGPGNPIGMAGGASSSGNCVAGICGVFPSSGGAGRYVHGCQGGRGSVRSMDQNLFPINQNTFQSGGGGGAGAAGKSAAGGSPGQGGDGLPSVVIDGTEYDFASIFGVAYTSIAPLESDGWRYVAGGGGGGGYCWGDATPSCWQGQTISGGKGGGGRGINGVAVDGDCTAGVDGTGGGGGGAKGDGALSCVGGSGIILIAVVNASSGLAPNSRTAQASVSNPATTSFITSIFKPSSGLGTSGTLSTSHDSSSGPTSAEGIYQQQANVVSGSSTLALAPSTQASSHGQSAMSLSNVQNFGTVAVQGSQDLHATTYSWTSSTPPALMSAGTLCVIFFLI